MCRVRPEFRIPLVIGCISFAIGCQNPELQTELNTLGPPEVTTVLVLSETRATDSNRDAVEDTNEVATFCGLAAGMKLHRGFCPRGTDGEVLEAVAVMDAPPSGWFARVVFSELLNPAIETLIDTNNDGDPDTGSIADSQPVEIVCGGRTVSYGGFYDPSGNDVTQRPGPALIIQPTEQVASGSECLLTVRPSVTDKEGFAVDPNFGGPFRFGLADMRMTSTVPQSGAQGIPLTPSLQVSFNAVPDLATLDDTTLALTDNNNAVVPVTRVVEGTTVTLTPTAPLTADTTYTVTVAATGIRDTGGGPLNQAAPQTITFQTVAP
jgi:hypothetical protein